MHIPTPNQSSASDVPDRSASGVPDRRRQIGAIGEQLAAEHMTRRGFEILDRNFRTRWGELDIVAANHQTLVFIEVKTLQSAPGGRDPLEAINPRKRAKVRRMAGQWLAERTGQRPRVANLRFDAIGILLDRDHQLVQLEHLEGAF
jgi:putative endonuclease